MSADPAPVRRSTLLAAAAAAVASLAAVWLWRRPRPRPLRALPEKRIVVVDSTDQWSTVGRELRARCSETPVLGLDCEWVTEPGGRRRPVALLQLATLDGLCVLVRLCRLPDLPEDLRSLLRDRSVLKVGVACLEDGALLLADHAAPVRGCVDLRHLAGRHPDKARLLRRPGLAALAQHLLGVHLSKGRRLRCSNWEADALSADQQEYAADDALVGALLFRALLEPKVPELTRSTWPRVLSACQGLVDCKYKPSHAARQHADPAVSPPPPPAPANRGGSRTVPTSYQQSKQVSAGYQLRKSQLYDNARLLAPDDQPLSVVENSKARWYVYKGLGDIVQEDPLVVKLRFEPAGRPQQEGNHGYYYLQEKDNCCVRCGASDGYVRKNIVPQEYRKHFPEIMKSHQSHDVLLMCVSCHQESNSLDLKMRQRLAEECHAPIGTEADVKVREDQALRKVKSAGRALLKSRDKLPPQRAAELESVLRDYYGVSTITDDILHSAANMCTNHPNSEYMSHGEAVYRHFCQPGRGLIQLERRWRQHFLDSMRPARLPELWSVDHNHAKIRWKIRRADWPLRVREDIWRRCIGSEYWDEKDEGPVMGLGPGAGRVREREEEEDGQDVETEDGGEEIDVEEDGEVDVELEDEDEELEDDGEDVEVEVEGEVDVQVTVEGVEEKDKRTVNGYGGAAST
ncbi:exonuclease 3'-5' domain-containing protein 2-like isoform X1 [Amphibalanus amphitrite]|uniref:exonuclease 3'-5' domain-containing protein 2-like isoform X1 n=1 Tax=Amphibalanus amphitrite TaxID=1232801 RepID=UPI001C91A707|nr:exonuclease 3'-5' domain-containing protein 2-like isoform X1 [Amphibalanus amphitrite]XP_043234843.1 exonuclease 3'-5' domain-containing protein 2-like isoform X1 [Amphibalanus amphitrite]